MVGISRHTGLPIDLIEHVAEAIETILATPSGTLVMHREFGNCALLPDGTFKPGLSAGAMVARALDALRRYEPRATFSSVEVIKRDGQVTGYRVAYSITDGPGLRVHLVELPAYRE